LWIRADMGRTGIQTRISCIGVSLPYTLMTAACMARCG
jgi:hypothetical protein